MSYTFDPKKLSDTKKSLSQKKIPDGKKEAMSYTFDPKKLYTLSDIKEMGKKRGNQLIFSGYFWPTGGPTGRQRFVKKKIIFPKKKKWMNWWKSDISRKLYLPSGKSTSLQTNSWFTMERKC